MESTNEIVIELQKEMLRVLLVKFYVNVGWVDYLGGKRDSQYTQGIQGVCPKPLTDMATRKEYVGWMESLQQCSTLHRKGVA